MTTSPMHLDCDGFADALADYLEGDAQENVRTAVDAHVVECAACRQLLDDLNAITVRAEALPALTPSRDLWAGIADRIGTPVIAMESPRIVAATPRQRAWLTPALAAAALVVMTAGITHVLTRASLSPAAGNAPRLATTAAPIASEPTAEIQSTASERPAMPATGPNRTGTAKLASATPLISEAEPVFASEISALRKIVKERRSQLDPATVAVLEQSIAVIDSAIAQSRAALVKDPASAFLATQLNHSLEKKVELLRTAALLPART
ncbi:MAG: zf-HC2 domain-containing protein [Gemmatimonadota bacterium]